MGRKPILPSKVRATSKITYDVVYSDDLGKDVWGEAESAPKKQIRIRNGQSRKQLIMTFCHEVFHILEYEYKIKIPHSLIHELEEPIYRMLKLNGWLKK